MRDKLFQEVKHDLIGPDINSDKAKQNEVIDERPILQYISGVLEPKCIHGSLGIEEEHLIDDNSTVNKKSMDKSIDSDMDEG